jgi:hypothetical protein
MPGHQTITIRQPICRRDAKAASVVVVTIDVDDDLVRFIERTQMDRRPHRCTRGHWLLPGHMIVGSMPCSCGRHTTWECECGDVTYEPALTESCTLLNGRGGGL